jgi:hypothetical protein
MIVLIIEMVKAHMNFMTLQSDSDRSKHHKNLMYIL